jgi:hypothetical protein
VCPDANKSAIRASRLRENARKKLVGEGEQTSPSIFFISLLVGDREEKRTGEAAGIVIARALAFALAGSLRKYRAIPAGTVAEAMVSAANGEVSGVHAYHYDDMLRLATLLAHGG